MANLTLSPAQFETLRKIIYTRSGIDFQVAKKYILESRLSARLTELGFDNFDQYNTFLSVGPFREDEFQEMFNRITINETSFFRNEPQLDVLEKAILPRLIEARRMTKRLRIWSAACSTGEEPYTLAIQVYRTLGIKLADWNVEIIGTDISEKALDVAKAGVYTNYAIRSTSATVLARYFTPEKDTYRINPQIQKMVRFEIANLKDVFAAKRFGTFDVILCRNVMIYFDEPMRARCAKMFHDQLAPDGYLFVGHSENLRGTGVPLTPLSIAQSFAYAKSPTVATEVTYAA